MPEFSSGTVVVSSGVTSTGLLVVRNARLKILDGGLAFETGVAGGGSAVVSGGGALHGCTVSSGGAVILLNEGYGSGVTVESGGFYIVSSGGYATKSEIRSGGTMRIFEDVRATNATVMSGGTLEVNENGYARAPVLSSGGQIRVNCGMLDSAWIAGLLEIDSGSFMSSSTVLGGGELRVLGDDSYAAKIGISSGGTVHVSAGAELFMASMFEGGAAVVSEGGICTALKLSGGKLTILPGALAENAAVNPGAGLFVSSGGTALEIMENGGFVGIADGADVAFVPNTINGLSLAGASATVHSGTTAADVSVGSGGMLEVFSGGKLTGTQTFEVGAVVSMHESAILDFNISEKKSTAAALVNDLSVVQGMPLFTITVSASQPNGRYALAGGATGFNSPITVQDTLGEQIGVITVGETFKLGDADCTLNLNSSTLMLAIRIKGLEPENPVGTKDRMSWDPPASANRCVVECSTDGFVHTLSVATSARAVDMAELPSGTYQWRVKADGNDDWADGEAFASEAKPGTPKVVTSNEDGCGDIFFASPDGVWDNKYASQHVGSLNDWNGTGECVSQTGRGRIRNLFFGSTDPNMLCLTDAGNGDALFVDDVYTDLPEEVGANTARLYRIREIRAGAGDDIVDMTSQRFEYTGDGLTIRGGDGDDIIWANKGSNALFGDAGNDRLVGASGQDVIAGGAGNDRMHGGGGDDVFTFCDNWGADKVEQLASGTVTLWFASGDESNWNAGTLTYTDGNNSVTVSGVTADKITLKFGDDGSAQFAEMTAMGPFDAFSSRLIFEESGAGILASL